MVRLQHSKSNLGSLLQPYRRAERSRSLWMQEGQLQCHLQARRLSWSLYCVPQPYQPPVIAYPKSFQTHEPQYSTLFTILA
jgi:hypothetical protein